MATFNPNGKKADQVYPSSKKTSIYLDPSRLLKSRDSIKEMVIMASIDDEVFSKVQAALVDALGVDDDEVTPEATMVGDLGAESIDFLDIVFKLEKASESRFLERNSPRRHPNKRHVRQGRQGNRNGIG